MKRSRFFVGAVAAFAVVMVSCGGGADPESPATQSTAPAPETTATTQAPATTTTMATTTSTTQAPTTTLATTTTMAIQVGAAAIHETFAAYMDLLVAKDYEGARATATGPAADYASFTEALDAISSQPAWQLDDASGVECCDVVALDNGRYATAAARTYTEPNGGVLAVSHPAVELDGSTPVLYEWGVDIGQGKEQPTLAQRLQSIARSPGADPSSCFPDGMWAYVPGGSDTSTEVRIIAIGRQCDSNHDLVPKRAESRLYAEDGSVDVTASTFLVEGGSDVVPVNAPTLYLAIFDIPRAAASSALLWDTPFDRVGISATTFASFEVGPFSLD